MDYKSVFALACACRALIQGEAVSQRASLGRGSLDKHGYVRLRARPLITLSTEQVILEATVWLIMVYTVYRCYLWPVFVVCVCGW